jgi:hypothetical protein
LRILHGNWVYRWSEWLRVYDISEDYYVIINS